MIFLSFGSAFWGWRMADSSIKGTC